MRLTFLVKKSLRLSFQVFMAYHSSVYWTYLLQLSHLCFRFHQSLSHLLLPFSFHQSLSHLPFSFHHSSIRPYFWLSYHLFNHLTSFRLQFQLSSTKPALLPQQATITIPITLPTNSLQYSQKLHLIQPSLLQHSPYHSPYLKLSPDSNHHLSKMHS
jgi:hypothetical protein